MKTKSAFFIIFATTLLFITACDKHEFKNPVDTDIELSPFTGELAINQLTDSSVKLSWQKNADVVEKYVIERKINTGSYSFHAEVEANLTQYTDNELLIENIYYYKVTGVNDENHTNSISNSIRTSFAPITNFVIIRESLTSAKLIWSHNCTYETGYVIERRELTKNKTEKIERIITSKEKLRDNKDFQIIAEISANNFNYTDNTVNPYQQYEYRIKAISDYNESDYITEEINMTFPAPTNLQIIQNDVHTFALTWNDNSVGEQGFKLDRKIDESEFIEIAVIASDEETYTDDINLRNNFETVYYKLYAYYETEESATIENNTSIVFEPITDLNYEKLTISSIQLSWTDVNDGEDGFMIEKRVNGGEWQEMVSLQTETECFDEDAVINATLQYRVSVISDNNYTDAIETEAIDNTFPAPTNLTFEILDINSIQLTWQDNSNGEDGFKIDKKVGTNDWLLEFAEVGENDTTWTDDNESINEEITYRVYAFAGVNVSSYIYIEIAIYCIDIDGNLYETVQIGDQIWMAENLKVTHYRNGDAIPHLTSNGDWTSTNSGAYCVYDNNSSNAETYGNLYNWYAVNDSRGIAPAGWRVPTDDEIKELEMALGMSQAHADATGWRGTNEGSKLAGRADLWSNGDLENNAEFGTSGFSFLPGGYRVYNNGDYGDMSNYGYLWSASESGSYAWNRYLSYYTTTVHRSNYYNKRYGFSVRCVRD